MDTATTTASYRTGAGTNFCLYFDPEKCVLCLRRSRIFEGSFCI
jgi:hypothetical protein